MLSARFSAQWPPAPNGRYRVALYKGVFAVSPIVYRQDSYSDHRTLKAAIRELAHVIARQARRDWKGERFDCLYIVTPTGERLSLTRARELLALSETVSPYALRASAMDRPAIARELERLQRKIGQARRALSEAAASTDSSRLCDALRRAVAELDS